MSNSYFKIADNVLTNMEEQSGNISSTSILLAGDPGVGKTSFVKLFSKLVGLSLVVVEVPHIIEEHVINVPFIVFNPVTEKTQSGNTKAKLKPDSKFDITLSDTYLATAIKQQQPIPNDQYLRHIINQPNHIQQMYRKFGGSETEIPDEINLVRSKFKTILFLDEYFRKTSPRIRNILRTILNGNVGIEPIPEGTYVMYASNLNDEGLDDVPLNVQMAVIEMNAPAFDEWVSYLSDKHGIEDDTTDETEKNKKGKQINRKGKQIDD